MNWLLFGLVALLALVLVLAGAIHWIAAIGVMLFAGVLLVAAYHGERED